MVFPGKACADECERQGMEGWLYDGTAGLPAQPAAVLQENPAYRMHYLVMHIQPGTDFVFPRIHGLPLKPIWKRQALPGAAN